MALPAEGELSEEQVLRYLAKLQPEQAAALLASASQLGPEDGSQDILDRSDRTESAKEAMRAIAAGNFAVAQELGPQSDLCCLGEDGWGFLHWVVHVAGAAGAASMQKEDHAGCQCCHTSSAHRRGPAFALLQNLLSSQEGRLAVDFPTSQGATPLMFAADAGDKESCEELLRARADVSLKDCDGDTAEAWALAKAHQDLARLLQS